MKTRIGNAIGLHDDLLTSVKRRNLKWYRHPTRSPGLAKTVPQRTVQGGRHRGRHKITWTGQDCPTENSTRRETNRQTQDHLDWPRLSHREQYKEGEQTGRQRKLWEDNIKQLTGLEWNSILRKTESCEVWRKLVVKSTVVPKWSDRLWDRWWWRWRWRWSNPRGCLDSIILSFDQSV